MVDKKEKIAKARDNFLRSIKRLGEKYKAKGVKIKSIEVEWDH